MTEMRDSIGNGMSSSVWGVACERFLSLGRDEGGAALVTTLALFMFLYLVCMGVFAVGTAVRERIHLQNAADAAAYSAAVVQADTLSRIATINRAMSWSYVDMTRLQMDYIVRRWLEHTCQHFEEDKDGGEDEKGKEHDSLEDYNKNSIPYKLGLGHILGPHNGPCSKHKGLGRGWYIGSDGTLANALRVHLNGRSPLKYRMPKNTSSKGLPSVSSGEDVLEAQVRAEIVLFDAKFLSKHPVSDLCWRPTLYAELGSEALKIHQQTLDLIGMAEVSADTRAVLLENLVEVDRALLNWDASGKKAHVDAGVPWAMKQQIAFEKMSIARMNVCERQLALELPGRIDICVQQVLEANIGKDSGSWLSRRADWSRGIGEVNYFVDRHRALGHELLSSLGTILDDPEAGYLRDLHNTKSDEEIFLAYSGFQPDVLKVFETGINQWFVRGNGSRRTDGEYGLQRSYKHWAEGPLKTVHATHSPLMPSCWNTEQLEGAEASVALFSEWQWWSDTWFCFDIYSIVPPGKITIHVNAPHYKEFWPSKASCSHNSKPGLLGLKSGNVTTVDWKSLLNGLEGPARSACIKHHKFRPPTFRSHDYISAPTWGLNFIASLDNLLGNYEPIEKYHDGCTIYPDLLGGISRSSAFKFTGYARLYADDPHLYDNTYIGMKALPLVLDPAYFGEAGTISVGVMRRNRNVFTYILGLIEGVFRAFDPDWNDSGLETFTTAFASSKAGYKEVGDSSDSAEYRVDWQVGDKGWNLCQSDWDAVFVPVRMAKSQAVSGFWIEGDDGMLEDWMSGKPGWKGLNGGSGSPDPNWSRTQAPRGVLRGGTASGILNWRGLSHVLYH